MDSDNVHVAPKRKRKDDVDVAVETTKLVKTNTKSKAPTAQDILRETGEVVPWPEYFTSLNKTHKALNLVYTFCSTRKHFATTFDAIRPTVESHTKKKLEIEELACIVSLRPQGIRFSYVDELTLDLDVRGSERDNVFLKSAAARGQAIAPDLSVGGLSGSRGLQEESGYGEYRGDGQVLYIEYIDGDLNREVMNKKTGEPARPQRKLRDEELKMPVYSQKQMTQLIERRNAKFTGAINDFLEKCAQDKIDPVMAAQGLAQDFIPQKVQTDEALTHKIPSTIPKERKPIPEIVEELRSSPWYTGQIVPDGHRVFEAVPPSYGHLNFLMSQNLVNALYNAKGITEFYAHQAEAINALHDGDNVVVATSTSSGKSLIYQLPVVYSLEKNYETRAMYIFPTKALAQDQKRSLKDLMRFMPEMEETVIETFDGDTLMNERNFIRENARIIFTNPDMLHVTILPQEDRWRSFLKNLRYVVVDELHYYNGQLGSHVAFVMRRLRRICAAVGNRRIQFISCSATVANPLEHFKAVFGVEDVRLVDFDGSPSSRKEFLCWNTPFKDPVDPASGRGSGKLECARLFCALLLRGLRIIAFCKVRSQCELLVNAIRMELETMGRGNCAGLVMAYRGGYTAQDRRQIETEMFQGKLLGIVSTTALELGIDIGSLDCVLAWGFPYSIANLRQQSGRAGRRNKDSLSILLGDAFATDQHYMRNPDELFSSPTAELQLDLSNLLIREGHIQCAAYEMPISSERDSQYFGEDLPTICEERLVVDELGFYHCHDRFRPQPAKYVALRDTEDEHYAVIDISQGRNVVLEEIEGSRANFTLYDGGIFLHQGQKYLVRDFLPERRLAKVEKVNVEWITTPRDFTDVDPTETEVIRNLKSSPCKAYFGPIKIQQKVYGFFKVDTKGRVLDAVHVDNSPIVRYSKGMWIDVPRDALETLQQYKIHIAAAIHAAQHCVMSLMPTFTISLPEDIRTECKVAKKEFSKKETTRKRPARLTFYDSKGGSDGSGISSKAFDHIDHLLVMALQRVEACFCLQGCRECVVSDNCKSGEVTSKAGARAVLQCLLGIDIDTEALAAAPRNEDYAGIETVIVAQTVPMKQHKPPRVENALTQAEEEMAERAMGGFEKWIGE